MVDENNKIQYTLPDFYGNKWIFSELSAIDYKDVNSDGYNNIIIIASYVSGHGENTAEEFYVGGVYFQTKTGFINIKELDEKIINEKQNESTDMLLEFIKDMDIEIK